MANVIQFKRGAMAGLPAATAEAGEPLFTTDEKKLYVGDGAGEAFGVIMDALLGDQSIIAAVSAGVPVSVAVAEQTILGRITDGDIAALSAANVLDIIGVESGADVTDWTNVAAALAAAAGDVDVNSQKIVDLADPIGNQDAATKKYVDSVAQGLSPIADCVAMTTGVLPACNYDNGTNGVGATLTGDANGALAAQDGVTLEVNERLLVKNQASALQNGVYKLTTVGDGANPFVLTRVTDMDQDDEIAHVFIFVTEGTTGADTGWVCTSEPELVDVGVDAITFAQFSAAGQITAGTGLAKVGNTLNVVTVLEDLIDLGAPSSDGEFIVATGAGVFAYESGATALASLGIGNVTNIKNKLDATAPPGVDNDIDEGYTVGSNWYDVTNDKAYVCLDNTDGAAIWIETTQAAGGVTTFVGLTDTPANYTNAALKIVRVNSGPNALEFVEFAATYLEGAPTEDEDEKAPTSEWAFDHNAAATGVHGAEANTLLHSASTIDGGTWA